MVLIEKNIDIFNLEPKYYLTHCISSDCKMGSGIAVEFNRRFKLKEALLQISSSSRVSPTCILVNGVFNLITKENYYNKPTYKSMRQSLAKMRNIVNEHHIKYIAMPKIGCGLDKLNWEKVKDILIQEFRDADVEIKIAFL